MSGHAPAGPFMSWYNGPAKAEPAKAERPRGRRNARGGTCPILGHRYRSIMERRWGLYLLFLGYRRWTGEGEPPPGLWYRYEGREWEFPGIKGTNYRYTADYECWPALPDPLRPAAPAQSYVVYEVKGYMDPGSKVRLKRMAKHFPEVLVVVVDRGLFDMYTSGAAGVVPGWNDHKEEDAR